MRYEIPMARQKIDRVGERYGRLVVTGDSGKRSARGDVLWECACDCGGTTIANAQNLKAGSVQSCGCLAKELSSVRGKARRVEPPKCTVEGCDEPGREYDRTLCAMHGMRMRRYGDPLYVTPDEVRSEKLRNAQLARVTEVKPTTYRKLFGRHEHRVIGEQIAGRPLRSDEHVHHKDENKHNNDPSNLEVLTAVEHLRLHAQMRSQKRAAA